MSSFKCSCGYSCNIYETYIKHVCSMKKEDVVNHPNHYMLDLESGVSVEALEILQASLSRDEYIGYLRGNILKYNIRTNKKGKEEDVLKACFYSDILKKILEDQNDNNDN
jgi:hypothetical protein